MFVIGHVKGPSRPVSCLQQQEKEWIYGKDLRREQQYISQSTQPPSRVLQLWTFLNRRYSIAPSGFLFHKKQDEEASAWCYSGTCDAELQPQSQIHLLVKLQTSERMRTWYNWTSTTFHCSFVPLYDFLVYNSMMASHRISASIFMPSKILWEILFTQKFCKNVG